MTPVDPRHMTALLSELADALQGALGSATALRRNTQAIADDAVALEHAVGRAVAVLRRVQPRRQGQGGKR